MQLYLRPLYNIVRQLNIIEWSLKHQKLFDKIKTFKQSEFQSHFQAQIKYFTLCAMPPTLKLAQHFYSHIKIQIK